LHEQTAETTQAAQGRIRQHSIRRRDGQRQRETRSEGIASAEGESTAASAAENAVKLGGVRDHKFTDCG